MKLLGFQLKMFELDELFADPDSCEFVIVTIPTDMAVKETGRLFEELKDGEVKVKVNHVLVNQVAGEKGEDDGEAFVKNVVRGQQSVVGKVREASVYLYLRCLANSSITVRGIRPNPGD